MSSICFTEPKLLSFRLLTNDRPFHISQKGVLALNPDKALGIFETKFSQASSKG